MPRTVSGMIAAIKRNLPGKTGKTWAQWVTIGKKVRAVKQSELVAVLKQQGLGHVTASTIARSILQPGWDKSYEDGDALVDTQYAGGKAPLRPLYEKVLKLARGLGKDVRVAPCATYVPLVRKSQFAVIKPSTKTRLDVGLKLGGAEPTGRLERAKGMGGGGITHVIRIESAEDVDAELKRWMKAAYDANA